MTSQTRLDPVLDLAIRACGIASLDNVQRLVKGREYSRTLYGEALRHLNANLRDAKASKTDDSLVAVAMLGYYEVSTTSAQIDLHLTLHRTSPAIAGNQYFLGRHTCKEPLKC